jgi:trigger factor
MTLKVDVEMVDAVRRRLAVEVSSEEVQAEIEKAYAELGRAAKVPGFRPGRVPRHVLERMFGDRVRADVFGKLIQRSYAEVIEQQQIAAVGQPEIVTEQAEAGASLRYTATVEVKPEVVAEHYAGLEAERPLVAVSEADVEAAIERLRQSLAQLQPITERSEAQSGDVLTLDYQGHIDGRLAGRGEHRDIELGANSLPPEFDQNLLGARVGSEVEFDAAYPPDHANAELRGKTVHFNVRVQRLSRKELPGLDDEFAKDHGACATLDELRARVRQQLQAEATQAADAAVQRALLDELSKRHDIPVPAAMVQRRTEALVDEVWHEWQQQRLVPKNESQARDRLRTELEPRAREQVKLGLLLEAIARQEGITVSEDDVEARVAALAAGAGTAAERVRALYQNPEAHRQLHARMLQGRAINAVVARATIKDVARSPNIAEVGENG